MAAFYSSIVFFAIGFGLGYWLKGRGVSGIQSDLADAKAQVEALKNKAKGLA